MTRLLDIFAKENQRPQARRDALHFHRKPPCLDHLARENLGAFFKQASLLVTYCGRMT